MAMKKVPERMIRPEYSDTQRNLRLANDYLEHGSNDAADEYKEIMDGQTYAEWLNELKNMYDMYPDVVVESLAEDGITEAEIRKVIGYDQENN